MSPGEILAMYRSMCLMTVVIRRYSGLPGARTSVDKTVKGHFRLYSGKELVGTITQGDQAVIVLADDLVAAGFPAADHGRRPGRHRWRERKILAPIGERKALDGTLIAYDLQARG
jgi:hypothetical protein